MSSLVRCSRGACGVARPLLAFLLAIPAFAQFTVEGVPVQAHAFFSQGFMYSTGNNYMTAPTTQGSFAFTDGGVNISAQIWDKLRVGAQLYDRNVGNLGNGHLNLDWATVDYRVNDHIGVRAGKVKTVFGLFNDTQDLEFLHTWALLPQSVYPLDLRGYTISHTGADLYGSFDVRRLGTISYTVFGGLLPNDPAGGNAYGLQAFGVNVTRFRGAMRGADLKWQSPLSGLLAGAGVTANQANYDLKDAFLGGAITHASGTQNSYILSAEYTRGAWRLDAEYTRSIFDTSLNNLLGPFGPPIFRVNLDERGWYAAGSWRASKRWELGGYYSQFRPHDDQFSFLQALIGLPTSTQHQFDTAATVRFDFFDHFDLKIEGHRIDGGGDPAAFHGIYPQDNPQGIRPRTNLLVVRLGFNI